MNQSEELFSTILSFPQLSFVNSFLRENTHAKFFLVGGAIRDLLLKRNVYDFDFVVQNLSSTKLESWLKKNGTVDFVGKTFGVYKFIPNGFDPHRFVAIDIALPRTEHSTKESVGGTKDFSIDCNPDLPIEQDLERRDFTINAMAYDLRSKILLDPFGGMEDLKQKRLRSVGNPSDRFLEDLTRIVRGIRFACELNFTIESETLDAIMHYGPRLIQTKDVGDVKIPIVARELIGKELIKGFRGNPKTMISLLVESQIISVLFPIVSKHLSIESTYLDPIFQLKPRQSELAIALLLRCCSEQEIRQIYFEIGLQTIPLKLRGHVEIDDIIWITKKLQQTIRTQDVQFMRASQFEKWFMNERGIQLTEAISLLKNNDVVYLIKKRKSEICERWICEESEPIPPLLTGEDILAAGIPEGPRVRDYLELLRDQQLDGKLMTRESALKWLKTQSM